MVPSDLNKSPILYRKDEFLNCKQALEKIKRNVGKIKQVLACMDSDLEFHLQAESHPAIAPVNRSEAIENGAEFIYQAHRIAENASQLVRDIDASLYEELLQKSVERDSRYQIKATETELFITTPIAPFSIYRSALKSGGRQTHAYVQAMERYNEVRYLLDSIALPDLHGRKLLYICHSFDSESKLSKAPDFDNYDVKDLIDCVTDIYGFDHMSNLMVIHDCIVQEHQPNVTFLAICELWRVANLGNAIERFQNFLSKMEF